MTVDTGIYRASVPFVTIGSNGMAEVHLPFDNVFTDRGLITNVSDAFCVIDHETLHEFRSNVDLLDDAMQSMFGRRDGNG